MIALIKVVAIIADIVSIGTILEHLSANALQAMLLTPQQALALLKYILQTGKVISLDVAELSPPLDQG